MTERADGQGGLWAGSASADLTPHRSVFLFGYPHVPRWSTGVHDQLESTALYLRAENRECLIIANDLIFVGKQLTAEVRSRISAATGVPVGCITITATHTHSGPITVDYVSNSNDPVVPKADADYLSFAAQTMVQTGCAAVAGAMPAEIGCAVALARGVGTNRHDPTGLADPEVPVLLVRNRRHEPIACMLAYAMHTTVLHEDSTLISGDFPHFTRRYLVDRGHLPANCPILYHNGASGDQSPRHVTQGNTFAEAKRLGELLGEAIAKEIPSIRYATDLTIRVARTTLALRLRNFPALDEAVRQACEARARFEALRTSGAPRTTVRTAECDWFGAEESVALARASLDGRLAAAASACMPAEIFVVRVGVHRFVFWPGEFFVEYALAVKARSPDTFVITMANGELQGYIVTPEAAARGVYEATNAVFSPHEGRRVVDATLELLAALN